jgi:putative transposase
LKFACIELYILEFEVRLMCRVLSVSPAGFYAWRKRSPSRRSVADLRLGLEIHVVHREVKGRYGAVKVHRELKGKGISCGKNRVARLMHGEGLRSKRTPAFRVTTQSGHSHPMAENQLKRKFDLALHPELNRSWAADMTYVPTREGWLYLAVVLDLASRRVVGWSIDKILDRPMTQRALEMALRNRCPSPGALHHSDRGGQYASHEYQWLLSQHGMKASMSRPGDCWDNAVVESFFRTVKAELVNDARWHTRRDATTALVEFIEIWYNGKRRHQTLGYLTPVQYENEVLNRAKAA